MHRPPAIVDARRLRHAWQKATELLIEAAENGGDIEAATRATFVELFLQGDLTLD